MVKDEVTRPNLLIIHTDQQSCWTLDSIHPILFRRYRHTDIGYLGLAPKTCLGFSDRIGGIFGSRLML
jgi:hypothetical protein